MRLTRHAGALRLRSEHEQAYRKMHMAVWPDVLAALTRANIRNFSIFLHEGLLFSYFEHKGEDYAADMATVAEDAATQQWWAITEPCQQPLDSAAEGEWWATAEELFHLD